MRSRTRGGCVSCSKNADFGLIGERGRRSGSCLTLDVDVRRVAAFVSSSLVVASCNSCNGCNACDRSSTVDGWVGKGAVECNCEIGVQRGRLAARTSERIDDGTSFHYRAHRFANASATTACMEIVVTQYTEQSSGIGFRVAAYRTFDPNDVGASLLAGDAKSDAAEHRLRFNADAGEAFDVVVTGPAVGTPAEKRGVTYRLDVHGCRGGDIT
jgi:hypothetical protein